MLPALVASICCVIKGKFQYMIKILISCTSLGWIAFLAVIFLVRCKVLNRYVIFSLSMIKLDSMKV